MVRLVEHSKLSSIIIIYAQILTTLAENNRQIQTSNKIIINTRSSDRTLNSSSAQENKSSNQESNQPQKYASLQLNDRSTEAISPTDQTQSNGEESGENSNIDNGEPKKGGAFILEDLVNRFLEKNGDAVRRSGVINDGQTIYDGDSFTSDEYATQQVNGKSSDSYIDGISYSTTSPPTQSINAQLNEESKSDELLIPASQQGVNDSDIDRHIQYDVVEPEPEPEPTKQHKQKLRPRHAINELSALKLDNYTATNTSEEPQSETNNAPQAQTKQSEQIKQKQQQIDNSAQFEIYHPQNVTHKQAKSSPEQDQIFVITSNNNLAKSEQQQVAAAVNSSSVPRAVQVQARSMSNGLGISANKTPQHTRPPYATYDQFHHRTDTNSNKKTISGSEQAATPATTLAGFSPTGTGQVIALSISNSTGGIGEKANASAVQDAATLVHSISQISSQLASDTARGELGMKQRQQLIDKDENLHENSRNMNGKEQLQLQLHKLASSDQLVELNPIPVSISIPMNRNDQEMPPSGEQTQSRRAGQLEGVDRFYFSKENQLFSLPAPHTISTRSQSSVMDKYNIGGNNLDQDSSIMGPNNVFNVDEINSNYHQLAKIASQYPGYDNSKLSSSMIDSRTTNESFNKLSNNERTRENQIDNSNDLDKHHYAASLINVTAPMILPLSATEAMESSLGDQVAAKNLLHQVSGFLRSPSSSSSSSSSEVVKSTTSSATKVIQPPRLSQYHVTPLQVGPSDSRSSTYQSIYSQPANQFSPKLHLNNELNSVANNETYLEERMRLNRNGIILAGRKPPVAGYSASQSLTGHSGHANNATHQASGFRSPLSHSSTASTASTGASTTATLQGSSGSSSTPIWPPSTRLPTLSNYLSGSLNQQMAAAASERPPTTINNMMSSTNTIATPSSIFADNRVGSSSTLAGIVNDSNNSTSRTPSQFPVTTTGSMNGMVNAIGSNNSIGSGATNSIAGTIIGGGGAGGEVPSSELGLTKPIFNLTRVEHISAECSNDLIRTVIIFNGTFKGIIYSSGYVRDPNCVYINGTGKTRYQFSIRLNQCGTLGRQELHPPVGPNEIRRRDQVMWNTLSIQYNPIIEQEWDEHFRVSCEYGSDFWKTVSFNPFNVETNTGSPVVFTVDPPQCQMEILRGHGMVGPRQEAVSGPVTVGDPLTLLIHMKSERAGYDILVKNCIAHNGGHQKMQLIDNNGCVVNERFISPFRGTYNDNDMKHVTLYSYLKAFRFTGSPVLYLECEIHMCQSSCPPQMCYWRRLSKRSTSNETTSKINDNPLLGSQVNAQTQYQEDFSNEEFSISGGFKVDDNRVLNQDSNQLSNQTEANSKTGSRRNSNGRRQLRKLSISQDEDGSVYNGALSNADGSSDKDLHKTGRRAKQVTTVRPLLASGGGQISDKVSLFQALEVRQEREPDDAPFSPLYSISGSSSSSSSSSSMKHITALDDELDSSISSLTSTPSLMCYRRAEVLAFLFTAISVILVAICISIGFCWRAANLRKRVQHQGRTVAGLSGSLSSANIISRMSSINNLLCKNPSTAITSTADTSSISSCSISPASPQREPHNNHHHNHNNHHHPHPHHSHHHHCVVNSSLGLHPNQLRLSPILQNLSSRHKDRPL